MEMSKNWQVEAVEADSIAQEYLHESKVFAIKGFPVQAKASFEKFREYKRGARYARRQRS